MNKHSAGPPARPLTAEDQIAAGPTVRRLLITRAGPFMQDYQPVPLLLRAALKWFGLC
jgi:hypothetical protein